MVQMCKRISPDVFFIFSKFCFSGLLGGKRAKNGSKNKKLCLSHFTSQEQNPGTVINTCVSIIKQH